MAGRREHELGEIPWSYEPDAVYDHPDVRVAVFPCFSVEDECYCIPWREESVEELPSGLYDTKAVALTALKKALTEKRDEFNLYIEQINKAIKKAEKKNGKL